MKGFHDNKKGTGIVFDDIFLISGARTPFGKYCGSLSRISPTDLGIHSSIAALEKAGIKAEETDQVIAANIGQSSCDAYFLPRHISLYSGIPQSVPALMVQRICGSGLETIITAGEQITLGKAGTILCTGTENMSLSPTVSFGNRMGYHLGKPLFHDMLWEALTDTAAGCPMGYTAENIAKKYKITRKEADEFACLSFERTIAAANRGFFNDEISPVIPKVFYAESLEKREITLPGGITSVSSDEHVRPSGIDALSKLPPVFSKVGILTAGNSSGVVDGSASAVVAHRDTISAKKLKYLSRVAAGVSCGTNPKEMGLSPVPAIRLLLEATGLKISDIGLFEINEAFSAQLIGCERELGIDRAKLNVNGGAIAIGHPLAATGVRLAVTLSREMKIRKVKYGIASICIGGGQGTALLLENMENT